MLLQRYFVQHSLYKHSHRQCILRTNKHTSNTNDESIQNTKFTPNMLAYTYINSHSMCSSVRASNMKRDRKYCKIKTVYVFIHVVVVVVVHCCKWPQQTHSQAFIKPMNYSFIIQYCLCYECELLLISSHLLSSTIFIRIK